MRERHRLLQRQLKRYNCNVSALPQECEKMIQAINNAYWEADEDREMLERALELSSQELLQANSKMTAIIQSFPDVFLRINDQGLVIACAGNPDQDLYPWAAGSVGTLVYDIFGESPAIRLKTAVDNVMRQNIAANIEFEVDNTTEKRYYEARLLPILDSQIFVIIRDISERKQAEEQLVYYSMFDPLTGLYNRAYFEKEMHRLQDDFHSPLGMIICDVDNLKIVNDTQGHECGDMLLVEVGRVLHQSLRKHDVIARIGGDEFAVLLPNADEAAVESTCSRIRETLKDHNGHNQRLPLSISIGYSVRNNSDVRMDDIFKEADDNMYKEKFVHHRMLSGSQIHTIFDTPGSFRFAINGRGEKTGECSSDLAVSIQYDKPETDSLDLLFHIDKKGDKGNREVFNAEPEIKNIGKAGEYREFLRSLITILNVTLNSLPVK